MSPADMLRRSAELGREAERLRRSVLSGQTHLCRAAASAGREARRLRQKALGSL
jgi:hypothetical protein